MEGGLYKEGVDVFTVPALRRVRMYTRHEVLRYGEFGKIKVKLQGGHDIICRAYIHYSFLMHQAISIFRSPNSWVSRDTTPRILFRILATSELFLSLGGVDCQSYLH